MECFRISQTETLQLINLYKQSEQLWNYKSHLYKRVDLKKKAWEKIAKQFKRDVKDVKKKIKYLRSAYVAEKKKLDDIIKSGAEAEKVHQPHLFYFSAFSFLDNVIVLRKIKSNYVDDTMERTSETREDGEHEDYDESNDDPLLSSTPYSKGRQQSIKYANAINKIMCSTSQVSKPDEHDKFTDFGKSIASQLKDLPPIEATAAMADLQQNLTRHIIRSLEKNQSSAMFKMEKLV